MKMKKRQIHEDARVANPEDIGDGTTVWQFSIILKGAKIGEDCNINAHCFIEGDVVVGNRVTLKCGVFVWNGIRIEDDVFVGPNVTFTNDRYPRSKHHIDPEKLVLKKGCSIGAGVVILPGITIGEYAMIGTGTVITKDVPAYTLWFGTPAKKRGYICACKGKLSKPFVCKKCGLAYEPHKGGLRLKKIAIKLREGEKGKMMLRLAKSVAG